MAKRHQYFLCFAVFKLTLRSIQLKITIILLLDNKIFFLIAINFLCKHFG